MQMGTLFRRVWLVFCDHSIAGAWRTKREAIRAAKLREAQASKPIKHYVVGPYLLADNATTLEVG